MITYISFLRGINIGGRKTIRMAGLAALYEGLGFRDVTTYIQSGNVLFRTDKRNSPEKLAERIEAAIVSRFHFTAPVMLRTAAELEKILRENPLRNKRGIDVERLHVTFLSTAPERRSVQEMMKLDFSPELFAFGKREIYLYCPLGYGTSKLANNVLDAMLHRTTTTRNWRTVTAMVDLAKKL